MPNLRTVLPDEPFFSYRRFKKRPIVASLERIALSIEKNYSDTYSQFSVDEIREIKKPIYESLPLPDVGAIYVFECVEPELAPDLESPETGSEVRVVNVDGSARSAYRCKVHETQNGREYWVSCLSLRKKAVIQSRGD
jgi:hypothetical protein